jgi:thiosulfate/3-mercaptopyruvate sulfurtransferase
MPLHECAKRVIVAISALALVSSCETSKPQHASIGVDPELGTLVTTEWLAQHLDDPDLVVIDCSVRVEYDESGYRSVSGRSDYEAGHIPSAVFADLKGDLRDQENHLEFGMPTPEEFAAVMGALGVGDNSRVVLYDNSYSVWAARVWWMLRWIGFDRAALLDGGLQAWTAEDRPLSTEPASGSAQRLTPNPRPELIADRDEVFAAMDNAAISLIDALPESHFRGEFVLYERSGHIPGAINVPSSDLLDESAHYRPLDELDAMLGLNHENRAITYCGGGVAASSNAFVMTRLGFTDIAVYMGSLEEWAADWDLPLEQDSP